MKSKKSLCNMAVIKSDIKRLWPLLVGIIVLFQLFITLPVFTGLYDSGYADNWDICYIFLQGTNALSNPAIYLALGILMAILLFSYLNKDKEAYNIHAFPIKRETLFISHYLVGTAFLIIPIIITGLFLTIICIVFLGGVTPVIFVSLVNGIIEALFFFNLSCFIMMVSGSNFISGLVYSVINALPFGISMLKQQFQGIYTYGIQESSVSYNDIRNWTPAVFLHTHSQLDPSYDESIKNSLKQITGAFNKSDFAAMLLYIIPIIILFALAIILYKKRNIESAGETMVFGWAKSIFRIVFTSCAALIIAIVLYYVGVYNFTAHLTYDQQLPIAIVLLIISCFVSYIIANMILQKTFKVLKTTSYPRCMIITVAMLIILVCTGREPFKFNPGKMDQISLTLHNFEAASENEYNIIDEYAYEVQNHATYQINPKDASELSELIHVIVKKNQKRPVRDYEYIQETTAATTIMIHEEGFAFAERNSNLYFDLTREEYEIFHEFANRCGTVVSD